MARPPSHPPLLLSPPHSSFPPKPPRMKNVRKILLHRHQSEKKPESKKGAKNSMNNKNPRSCSSRRKPVNRDLILASKAPAAEDDNKVNMNGTTKEGIIESLENEELQKFVS